MASVASREPKRTLPATYSTPAPLALLRALSSPHRRKVLRFLHVVKEARSPKELTPELQMPLSHVSYHTRFLAETSALTLTDKLRRRGAWEHYYASTIWDSPLALDILSATAEADEK
jgi:DNA-binding transcriptional ArsR family regulator